MQRGVDVQKMTEGLGYTVEELLRPWRRIDWETFRRLHDRVQEAFPEPDKLRELGRPLSRTKAFNVFKAGFGLIASPVRMYSWINKFTGPLTVSNVRGVLKVDGDLVDLTLTVQEGYEPSTAFFHITAGIYEGIPSLCGLPPSLVDLEVNGRTARFLIRPPPSGTLFARIRRLVSRMFSVRNAIGEIESAHHELQKRYLELEKANSKIRNQTALLAAVNDFSTLCAQSLEFATLGPRAVEAIARQSSCSVELEVNAADHRIAWTGRAKPGSTGSDELSGPTQTIPVARGDKKMGVLRVQGTGEISPFIQAIVPTLGVALDNAMAYKEVQDYRDNLEIKVRSRTAELNQTTEKLQQSLNTIQEIDRARAEFFANVAHEIRTPLTMISAPLDALLLDDRGTLPLSFRTEVEAMRQTVGRVHRLADDLLDHAKVGAGKMTLRRQPTDLSAISRALADATRPLATRNGLKLTLSVQPERFPTAFIDAERVEQMALNLITNAIKFTPSGGTVAISLSVGDGFATIAVRDTGLGIAKEDQSRLFDRFAQADNRGVRRIGGTGLGLALVKQMAELHGGSVSLESEPGKGSTFAIRFPLGAPSDDAVVAPPPAGARSGQRPVIDVAKVAASAESAPQSNIGVPETPAGAPRVLVVEDDDALRAFLHRQLASRFQILLAKDGQEGLDRAKAERPDLVLSDVMMPRMSGLQMTHALRTDGATSAIPIILLTARKETEHASEGIEMGANDYVGKPFHPRELIARIEGQLKLRDAARKLATNAQLATLGMVSGGFAHEVRNPLSSMLNAFPPLKSAMDSGGSIETLKTLTDVIEKSSKRVQHLAESLLRVARPVGGNEPFDVVGGIESTLEVISWKIDARIRVTRDFKDNPVITGDPGALNQVWTNLIDNALYAMPNGGELRLVTERAGDRILVRIEDTGSGIPQAALSRLFEPFFSTKEAGQGTGLGLAICQQIIGAHGGVIRVRSEIGRGTQVEVSLPAGDQQSPELRSASTDVASRPGTGNRELGTRS
jgi:signal transduction histidine kinase